MELTGPGPVVVSAAVAVLLFVLLVLGRPRLGGSVVRAVTRGVQVLALNAVVVSLCFVLLNDQYVFYSSWADLFGSRSGQVVEHHGGNPRHAVQKAVSPPGPTPTSSTAGQSYALPQPGSRLQTYTVRDATSGASAHVLVYLPAGYDPNAARTYPVILGLHGLPGNPQSFAGQNFFSSADQLTAEHKLAPSIFVVPMIDVPAGVDTECINGPPGEPQTETWLSREIPDWAVSHLRVETDRTAWVTLGYSYGGWCAALLTMRHPDVFAGAIVLEGYFRPDFESGYDPYGPGQLRQYDLVQLARNSPPPVAMWVFVSRQDGLSYPSTARFLSNVRPPLAVNATIVSLGGHRVSVYSPYVPSALTWLGQTFPPFHP
ncbi:MAG: alpha/beta hydrolase [Actinomycetes bacterium]